VFSLTPDQEKLRAAAREMAQEAAAQAAETDRTTHYPWPMVRRMTEGGYMGLTVPREWGGRGGSYLDAVLVVEEFAKGCAVCGRIAVEANMGAIGAIMAYGTPSQKRIAADLVLAGDKPAICITEPEAGSAASEMSTTAVRRGDRWIINGTKHWITGGGVSKLHLIFARAIEDGEEQGIGGFLVVRNGENDPANLVVSRRIPSMGLCGMPEAELQFRDLEVPDTMVLRAPGGFKRGFGKLMDAYNGQRVGAATAALGIAAGAYDHALRFVQERRQFGRPIAEFQGLGWMLADMSIKLEASRALIWQAAASAGAGGAHGSIFPDRLMAARAKVLAADSAVEVTNMALQLWGAAGYSRENPMERAVRDARMFPIAGGTAQILRNQVAEQILGRKLPQTRDGMLKLAMEEGAKLAAE